MLFPQREKLDAAQEASLRLDKAWGKLRKGDFQDGDVIKLFLREKVTEQEQNPSVQNVIVRYDQAKLKLKEAEEVLKPWIIRHTKPNMLPLPFKNVKRRCRIVGKGIIQDKNDVNIKSGLSVEGKSLLPFLLASRAAACSPESRPVFAEGLASSYEAFVHTRKRVNKSDKEISFTDEDDEKIEHISINQTGEWYLEKLHKALPLDDPVSSSFHPKISATVNKAIELWEKGEKVLIFCHYIATGRVLRRHVSSYIKKQIIDMACEKLNVKETEAAERLNKIGNRFFDLDSPLRKSCDSEIGKILNSYPDLLENRDVMIDLVRRNLRTPSFLVRFFPLSSEKLDENSVLEALETKDGSSLTLRRILEDFFSFLCIRCGREEKNRYIDAIKGVQTGSHFGADIIKTFGEDEIQGDKSDRLIPNVRLLNGATRQDTRQRLMLTFNTPFYPEILIASSVMAEGVDLHLNCRHIIHHDLCWNPSTLEQRTGRIDRIGSKAERCGQSITVYIPYISETQDEKMYKVVMDRERWFKVVMGEKYKVDFMTAEKLAERISFPEELAKELTFKLEV